MNSLAAVDAIVLAAGPNGLGAVRSLNAKGLTVGVITATQDDPSLHSRYAKFRLALSDNGDKAAQLESLLQQIEGFRPVLIPTSDWFVTFISERQQQVRERCDFCIPDEDTATMLIDKAEETKRIAAIIPVPHTIQQLPATADELLSQLQLPIIIKPRSHKHQVLGRKNIQLHTPDEAAAFYQQFAGQRQHLIAQQIIGGEDDDQYVCNCCFDHDGEMLQAFVFRRLRLSPAHYGVTSFAESVAYPEVISLCKKLGKSLNYTGPAMIEFMRQPETGELQYIEINPRIGLCNWFDSSCGINNVYATWLLARGDASQVKGSRMETGKVFLSLYEDIYSRLKDDEPVRQILVSYSSRFGRPFVFPYFSLRDPLPALFMAWTQLSSLGSSLWKRIARS